MLWCWRSCFRLAPHHLSPATTAVITSIQGTLSATAPLRVIVELNGFGYEVNVPVTTAEKLPPPGSAVKLHTLVS